MEGEELLKDLARFEREVIDVIQSLVLPTWGTERHGYPQTLYGYMMLAFARLDLISAYWKGTEEKQTGRMISFLVRYGGRDEEAVNIAVQIWRHKLMHTAAPRDLIDEVSGKKIRYLLHWWEHLPENQHFTFSEAGTMLVLNLGLVYLIRDLSRATQAYLSELKGSEVLQRKFRTTELRLKSYKYHRKVAG